MPHGFAGVVIVALCLGSALAQGGKPQGLLFRGTHYFLLEARAGESIEFGVEPFVAQRYGTKRPEVQLVSADGTALLSRRGISEPMTATARAPRDGFCALRVRGFRDWYQVRFPGRPIGIFHSELQPLHITGAGQPLYFMVPQDAKRFRVSVQCDSPNEGATVRIVSPAGEVALEKTDQFDAVTQLDVPVPKEHAGGIWAIELANPRQRGETYGLDDTVIFFSDNIPPIVSPEREGVQLIAQRLARRAEP